MPQAAADAVLREEWDRRVRLAEERGDQDMSAALRRAFAALEADGVVARETLGYDSSEGHHDATEAARASDADGYVFFHYQDAARLLDGPFDLCLRFGAARRSASDGTVRAAEDEAIGRKVVAALEAEGLPVDWNGRAESVIAVTEMAWYATPGPQPV